MPDNVILPGGIVSMDARAAERLIAAGNGDAALLYLSLAAGRTLRWDAARHAAAHEALVGMGLVSRQVEPPSVPVEPADEPPEYSAADITRELEDTASSFPGLVNEVQRRLGKILSTADLKSLYTLYDFLALPAEVICMLVYACTEDAEEKYGPGHKPRMSQIRKEAFVWRRLGIDTAEAVEAHLKRQAALQGRERSILPLVGVTGRPPVGKEREFIAAWVDMGFPDDVLRLAYERTVYQKQAMSWPYMNSILKSWHKKGLRTVTAIQAGDSSRAASVKPAATPVRDEARTADEVAWMKKFLAKQKKEDA